MGQNQNGDQAKRYVQIPMDGGLDSIFAKSMDQIPSLTKLNREVLQDFVDKKKKLTLLVGQQRFSMALSSFGKDTVGLETGQPISISKNDRLLIIIEHPKLVRLIVLQVSFVRRDLVCSWFKIRDPRFDQRFKLTSEVGVKAFPVPASVFDELKVKSASLIREYSNAHMEDSAIGVSYCDYLTRHVGSLPDGDHSNFDISELIHPAYEEILTQEPVTGRLEDISLGGMRMTVEAKARQKKNALIFETKLPVAQGRGFSKIKVMGVVRGFSPMEEGTVGLNVKFLTRIEDEALGRQLFIMSQGNGRS
ncbi:MAG: PilZ domain-containing protein [Deltaproteobacteria bacterium]|nr:PilZ domain-containing protein [Deltaproteobacteria bacterium]